MQCSECGSYSFTNDYAGGTLVCNACGCCADVLRIASCNYKQLYDDSGNRRAKAPKVESFPVGQACGAVFLKPNRRRCTGSAPYKRSTYWAERISQWQEREPAIPGKDWCQIQEQYVTAGRPFPLTKDEIRRLLRSLDIARKDRGKRPRFVCKYLEKWLTIRHRLTGIESYGVHANDYVVDELRTLFNVVQAPFGRSCHGINGRSSMLNYNFLFRRFFDLIGESFYGEDFPPLKSPAKRETMVMLWINICHIMSWPYINGDDSLFGADFYVDPLDNGARNRNRPAPRREPAPQREPRPGPSTEPNPFDEELLDWFSATETAGYEC